jgi:hypothetical protein
MASPTPIDRDPIRSTTSSGKREKMDEVRSIVTGRPYRICIQAQQATETSNGCLYQA